MNVNLRLREIVEEKGLKQKIISEKTGMSADCISRILNATRKITAEEFLDICDALELDANEFRKPA